VTGPPFASVRLSMRRRPSCAWWACRSLLDASRRSRLELPRGIVVACRWCWPPTVLGFYVLIAIGPMSPLGRVYVVPSAMAAVSFEGAPRRLGTLQSAVCLQPFSAAFAAVDRAWSNQPGPLGVTIRHVHG